MRNFKRIIAYFINHGVFVLLPLLSYFSFNVILKSELNDFYAYSYALFFYFLLLFSVFYFVTYQTEKIFSHIENSNGRFKFLAQTIGIVFFLSLTFSCYYWCLYDYNSASFLNVKKESDNFIFLDFLFYSFGVFIMNNTSEIQANSMYAKLFVGTEMLAAFITLILILANFKELKFKSETK